MPRTSKKLRQLSYSLSVRVDSSTTRGLSRASARSGVRTAIAARSMPICGGARPVPVMNRCAAAALVERRVQSDDDPPGLVGVGGQIEGQGGLAEPRIVIRHDAERAHPL